MPRAFRVLIPLLATLVAVGLIGTSFARSRVFLVALAWSVGLHALWNAGASIAELGYGLTILSAALSVWQYRRLLANKGFRT